MKTYTDDELKRILADHKLWLETCQTQGKCANLEDADLSCVNLQGANLAHADLWGTNLAHANLKGANLTGTILEKKEEKVVSEVSSNFGEDLRKLLDKHGMKLVGPLPIIPK